jgi:hypothetical protein
LAKGKEGEMKFLIIVLLIRYLFILLDRCSKPELEEVISIHPSETACGEMNQVQKEEKASP